MHAGKLLGAIIGLGIGLAMGSAGTGLLLAVIGAAVGHTLDARANEAHRSLPLHSIESPAYLPDLPAPRSRAEIEREGRSLFALNVVALFDAVAPTHGKAGDVSARVSRFLTQTLAFSDEDVAVLASARASHPRAPEEAARICREELSAPERMLLLDALYAVAAASGTLSGTAREALGRMAGWLGLSDAEHASVSRLYVPGRTSDYSLLGLAPHATDEEVKKAFRRLAVEHHPDKVSYLGGTAVFRASETFRAIREAYEAILAARRA